VLELLDDLLVAYTTFPRTCIELYQKHVHKEVVLSSGSVDLDTVLRGGFKTGWVYELYGAPGAGKTQLCMSLSVSSLYTVPENKICYIDTKNDLVPERILQIFQAKSDKTQNISALANIEVYKCFHLDQLIKALELISSRTGEKHNTTKLVILDNLVSPIMSLVSTDINLAMNSSSKITQLAQKISKDGVAVVCTNHARFSEGDCLPALGSVWANLADLRIRIDLPPFQNPQPEDNPPNSNENLRRLTVVKGCKAPEECQVKVGQSGIQSVNKI